MSISFYAFLASLVLVQSTPSVMPPVPSPCNTSLHLDCGRGRFRCIPLDWMCDNTPDCENGMDELGCHYLHDCPIGSMICRNGDCVAKKFKCDGEWDCQKGEDEKFCSQIIPGEKNDTSAEGKVDTEDDYTLAQKCESPRFLCSSGQCLTQDAVCDGYADCPEKEDELNCTRRKTTTGRTVKDAEDDEEMDIVCKADTVACANKYTCIPSRWICDEEQDCEDGSDEANCKGEVTHHQQHAINCSADDGSFRCDAVNGIHKCIFKNLTCNGVNDCPSGEDEAYFCQHQYSNVWIYLTLFVLIAISSVSIILLRKYFGFFKMSSQLIWLFCLIVISWISDQTSTLSASAYSISCNSTIHFDCKQGEFRCIPISWACDNVPDCDNDEDELGCRYNFDCPLGTMICSTGECIAGKFKCDEEIDCRMSDDEMYCPRVVKTFIREEISTQPTNLMIDEQPQDEELKCQPDEFECSDEKKCIPSGYVCDGTWDCSSGYDEKNCLEPADKASTGCFDALALLLNSVIVLAALVF
ncbi:hypothetical protein WR25_25893 [Diploscapter pachys]|uniref:EGF-like domain-containing protein n=1 Tax=Diploscapter pachys TaxID=2018661 RepID=A0A2A2L1N2_9BILA|nr:hypothetical protein WR25_25893 [Diploscapter pachys]